MSHDPLIGCVFRGYRIERLLAAGGMGAVYLAREQSLANVLKVLKILLPDAAPNAQIRAVMEDRFEREALAASVLKHDNIAGVHTVGRLDNGLPCMVMDYIEGQTLHDVIAAARRLPPYRVMHYMCHVGRGLDFAHATGIVHRDLKPSNIMLCPKDWDSHFCVLLDFGMAKITHPIVGGQFVPTMGGTGLGTPSFMAVEQFRHADEANAQSDIYALAIIIWLMVTGEMPWGLCDTSTPLGLAELYERQKNHSPNPPPAGTLPTTWEQTLRLALSADPAGRHPSVRHFMVDLANGLESLGPHVKSGVQILRDICPKFIADAGPDAETVRNAPPRTIVAAWPRVDTPARVAAGDLLTQRELSPQRPLGSQQAQRTPIMSMPPTTTLGESNGALIQPRSPQPQKRRRNLGIFIATAAAVATIVLFAMYGGGRRSAAESREVPSATAQPVPTPAAPATIAPAAAVTTPIMTAPEAPAPEVAVPVVVAPTTAPPAHPPVVTTPAARAPTHAANAPSTPRSSAPPAKSHSDESRAQAPKFNPNAPAGEE